MIAVAAALAVLTSCGGQPHAAPAEQDGEDLGTAAADGVVVRLMEWRIELSSDTIAAGPVRFIVANAGTHPHEFRLVGSGVDSTVYLLPGARGRLHVVLPAGRYVVACGLRQAGIDHAGEGMRRMVIVR